jgi:hypothetical protein
VSQRTAPSFVSGFPEIKEGEEGEDDVKSAWPFDALGYTRVTMVNTEGCQTERWS